MRINIGAPMTFLRALEIKKRCSGITLIELLVAISVGFVVIAAIMQVFLGSKVSYKVNEGLARVQENGRFAIELLQQQVRMAGFQDRDIASGPIHSAVFGSDSSSGPANTSDTLNIAFGSGNLPNILDCRGQLAVANDRWRNTYAVSKEKQLLCTSTSEKTNKSFTESLASGVEDMQISYGEDLDQDGAVNRFSGANKVTNMDNVVAVRVCLIVATLRATDNSAHHHLGCDGNTISTSDGILRRSFTTTIKLRNRA